MKKISLKNLNTSEVELLSRDQLKNVLGGYNGGTTTSGDPNTTTCAPPPSSCKVIGDPTSHGGVLGESYDGHCVATPWGNPDPGVCPTYICTAYHEPTEMWMQSHTC